VRRKGPFARVNRAAAVGRALLDGLADAQGLKSVCDPDADDADGEETRDTGKDADEGLDLIDAADDFALPVGAVGVDLGQEELFIFVAGELAAVGEEANEESSNDSPGDEQRGYGGESGGESHTGRSPFWRGMEWAGGVGYREDHTLGGGRRPVFSGVRAYELEVVVEA